MLSRVRFPSRPARVVPSVAACVLALTLSSPAGAAPIDSKPTPDARPDASPALGTSVPAALSPQGPNQDRTVELLLRMGDNAQGAADAKPAKDDPLPLRKQAATIEMPGTSAQGGSLRELKDMVLGPSAGPDRGLPAAQGQDAGRVPEPRGAGFEPPVRTTAGPVADRGDGLLAHPAVRFIRENRALTLAGCAAVLVALWWFTRAPSRRKRR